MAKQADIQTDLTLEIDGENITFTELLTGAQAFADIVCDMSKIVCHKKLDWHAQVKQGSNLFCLKPPAQIAQPFASQIIGNIEKGLEAIENAQIDQMDFQEPVLKNFRRLAGITNRGASVRVWANKTAIDVTYQSVKNIDKFLKSSYLDYGSITGTLQIISTRKNLHAVIYDDLWDKAITCIATEELPMEWMTYFNKKIEVYGMIKYNKSGTPQSVEPTEIVPHPEPNTIPTYKNVKGILKDFNKNE